MFLALLQYWHLLCLDAPSVAILWTYFVAQNAHIDLPGSLLVCMFLAVWALYAADRILDFSTHDETHFLAQRHRFCGNHVHIFKPLITLALIAAFFLLTKIPKSILFSYLYLIIFVAAYILFVHGAGRIVFKEGWVGCLFATAVFIPAWTMSIQPLPPLFVLWALFAILCWLNCLLIERWDLGAIRHRRQFLLLFTLGLLIATGIYFLDVLTNSVSVASIVSFLILGTLHVFRRFFTPLTLRACADAALLTPLFLFSQVSPH